MTKNWEKEKEKMHELYMVRGHKLSKLQKIMHEQYCFQASERAYKQKFKEWKWFKKNRRSPSLQTEQDLSPVIIKGDHPDHHHQHHHHNHHHHQGQHHSHHSNHGYHHHSPQRIPDHDPSVYRMQLSSRGRDRPMQTPMEQAYDQFSPMQFDSDYHPSVAAADMSVAYGGPGTHSHQSHMGSPTPSSAPGMTLGPYGRGALAGPQVSLPSVSNLQHTAFKENIRDAETRFDMGHYDQVEDAIESALRSLRWLMENNG